MSDVIDFPNPPKYCFQCGEILAPSYLYLTFNKINDHKGTVLICEDCAKRGWE